MRRLLPTARSFLIHSGQAAALAAVAVLAMAAAPLSHAGSRPARRLIRRARSAADDRGGGAGRTGDPPDRLRHARRAATRSNSPFGLRRLPGQAARNHEGVDIAAPQGTGVFVAAEGKVLRTGYDPAGYGRFVEIRHPNGMSTLYGHLSRLDVATGDAVEAGARIGLVGSTGRSTGPHLHFEVRRGERQVNPVKVMGRAFEVVVADAAA